VSFCEISICSLFWCGVCELLAVIGYGWWTDRSVLTVDFWWFVEVVIFWNCLCFKQVDGQNVTNISWLLTVLSFQNLTISYLSFWRFTSCGMLTLDHWVSSSWLLRNVGNCLPTYSVTSYKIYVVFVMKFLTSCLLFSWCLPVPGWTILSCIICCNCFFEFHFSVS